MKLNFVWLAVAVCFIQCEKIPERSFMTVRAVSIDGSPLQEGQGIELNYGEIADVIFEYESDSPLDSAYIKLVDNVNLQISDSDSEQITNHPEQGDLKGTFTYSIDTEAQFDPPIGNPVVDREAIYVILINQVGTVATFQISVLPL